MTLRDSTARRRGILEKLHDAHAREREQLFVGRERELAAVDRWLATEDAPTCVFSVTGMGGIGKSTLLRQILQRARRARVTSIWIDGRACTRTPAGFLECVRTAIDGAASPAAAIGIASLVQAVGVRAVWCIDNYEDLELLDGWIRDGFLGELPAAGHLVVLASRQRLSEGWRADPVWRRRLQWFPLDPLTRTEAADLLRRAGVDGAHVDDLVRQAGGLPLALSVAADAYTRRAAGQQHAGASEEPLEKAEAVEVVKEVVSANLLREVAGEELARVLDVLACVPEADAELFHQVLGKPVPLPQLVALGRLSFVQTTPGGYRLHDVAQRYLLAELRQRDPGRFRRIRRRIVAVLLERLAAASPAERAAVAASLLAVCRDALPSVATYAMLSAMPVAPMRVAERQDLPHLVRLLEIAGSQPFVLRNYADYQRLLARVLEQCPENCRVVTGSDGQPAGFLCALLLSRETVGCLDAVEPGALERHMPAEYARLRTLPAAQADTYYAVMLGLDIHHRDYSWQELVGLLIRDGLARLGEGTRAIVGGTHPDLLRLLKQLGFAPYEPGTDRPDRPIDLHVLDLRGGRFGPWVVSLLEAVEGHGDDLFNHSLMPLPELKRLLLALHDPAPWRQSPLPATLGLPPEALRERLQRLVTGADPLPAPVTSYDREVLEMVAWRGLPPNAAAARLHVSRATLYRHLDRAVQHVHQALTNPLAFHSPSESRNAHESPPR